MFQPIYETEWYQACVSECAAILTEKGEESKIAILELHYLIGKRVLDEALHWERANYGEKVIENLASDIFLNIQNKESAARRLRECIQFAEKFPDLLEDSAPGRRIDVMKLPQIEGMRTPGWKYIKENLLPESKKCEHSWVEKEVIINVCEKCGKKK